MVVICPHCGEVNQVKVKILRPEMEIVCKKCRERHTIPVGITSRSVTMIKCPECGCQQAQTERCFKCGAGLVARKRAPALDEMPEEGKESIISKRYKMLSITAFVMIALVFLGSIAGFFLMMKNSDAYKLTESFVRNNTEIRETVGDDLTFGLVPLGSIKMSGRSGVADFRVHIKGSKGATDVKVFLRRSTGRWRVVSAVYTDRYGINRRITPGN